jgi:hypothetical protein
MPSLIKVSDLTKPQKSVVESVPRGVKLMHGPAGTGKTAAGVRRMLRLLTKDKVFANEVLVLLPQRALALPYSSALEESRLEAGGRVTVTTFGGVSRRIVELFFPLAAEAFGFTDPTADPVFLSLEAAQYHMAHVVGGYIDQQAYFDSVAIARNRLYSQLIDNLNKAAVVGFPHTEIADRLIWAWGDKDPGQKTIYQQAQTCANAFREYCLENSLIDFSLQVELFRYLWAQPAVRGYLVDKYRHLILDNIEEDTPVAHDVLLDWIPEAESALIIMDTDAGYRRFLGASPTSAERLAALVTTNRDTFTFTEADSFVTDAPLRALGAHIGHSLAQAEPPVSDVDPRTVLGFDQPRFYTAMIGNIANHIAALVQEQDVSPAEIVVLAPFLSDSLRYTLTDQLERLGVRARSHRPSRALREEPVSQALLTWAQLAHPAWNLPPTPAEVTAALVASVEGLDLVRAQLGTQHLYRNRTLASFDALTSGLQDRLTHRLGALLQAAHTWLQGYENAPVDEIDVFWHRLFGELLARRGFGLHDDPDAAEITANLIDSARKFRRMMNHINGTEPPAYPIALEYVQMVRDGVIADQYLRSWDTPASDDADAVLLAPAYTFLMSNRPVDYQFWLNVGSSGWWERLYQPLTHPYVLTRDWPTGQVWTDEHEYHTRNQTLYHLAVGLVRRCRREIYLGFSELGEQGYEQRGALLEAIQQMLRRLHMADEAQLPR